MGPCSHLGGNVSVRKSCQNEIWTGQKGSHMLMCCAGFGGEESSGDQEALPVVRRADGLKDCAEECLYILL